MGEFRRFLRKSVLTGATLVSPLYFFATGKALRMFSKSANALVTRGTLGWVVGFEPNAKPTPLLILRHLLHFLAEFPTIYATVLCPSCAHNPKERN